MFPYRKMLNYSQEVIVATITITEIHVRAVRTFYGIFKLFWYILIIYILEERIWCLTPLSTIFQVLGVSFIGGGNRSTRRKSPTCRKSLTNFIT
jgi:hypothetical protein